MQSACMYVCSLTWRHLSDLKRFSDSNARARKLSTYVNFPLKELELKEFSSSGSGRHPEKKKCSCAVALYSRRYVFSDGVFSPPAERVVYNLYAVSNHSGNTLGGHYTAFCRHPTLGEWHFYNDARYGHVVPPSGTCVAVGKLQCRCKPFFPMQGQPRLLQSNSQQQRLRALLWTGLAVAQQVSVLPAVEGAEEQQAALSTGQTLPVPGGESTATTDCEESSHCHPATPRCSGQNGSCECSGRLWPLGWAHVTGELDATLPPGM